jgi:hypothetical protein
MDYTVQLSTTDNLVPVTADKFVCERGYTVFYARPSPAEKFEEKARFLTKNVKKIEES